jgi:hypothetical protein
MHRKLALLLFTLLFLLSACGGGSTPANDGDQPTSAEDPIVATATQTEIAPPPTETPLPTATVVPTATALPNSDWQKESIPATLTIKNLTGRSFLAVALNSSGGDSSFTGVLPGDTVEIPAYKKMLFQFREGDQIIYELYLKSNRVLEFDEERITKFYAWYPDSTQFEIEFDIPELDPDLNQQKVIPVTGEYVDYLYPVDQTIIDFMQSKNIRAATLTIARKGEIVLNHGYGWFEKSQNVPTPPDVMMRIASVSKPITAAAIRHLIREGKLTLDTRVFCQNEGDPDCVLYYPPLPDTEVDERVYSITINYLINHTGGWDRDITFDPLQGDLRISKGLNVELPIEPDHIIQYMLSQPLDHPPGLTFAYSNYGYFLLGEVIEELTGMSYIDYVKETIFEPLGYANEVFLGGNTMADRLPLESSYDCEWITSNMLSPEKDPVCAPYGLINIETWGSAAGIIASSRAIAAFASEYCFYGEKTPNCRDYYHFGALDGVASIVDWRSDGTKVVLITNDRCVEKDEDTQACIELFYGDAVYDLVDEALDGIIWP